MWSYNTFGANRCNVIPLKNRYFSKLQNLISSHINTGVYKEDTLGSLSTIWFVKVLIWQHFAMSTFWFVKVSGGQYFSWSMFWFVDVQFVSICLGLSIFWFVNVSVCGYFGLSMPVYQDFGCQCLGLLMYLLVTYGSVNNVFILKSVKLTIPGVGCCFLLRLEYYSSGNLLN